MTQTPIADRAKPGVQRAFSPATSRGARILLIALVLLSFGLRMWQIEAKSIWWDESLSLYRAQKSVPYILSNRIDFPGSSTTDLHPPLYFLLLHYLTDLSGERDLVLRLPSVAFATLIVPLLYALGRRLRGVRAGMLAALFGALSPFYLWYAQEVRMYTMVTALGLASVYCLWRAFTEQKWSWALGFGLAASAAMTTQYLFGLIIVCEVPLAFFLWSRPSTLSRGANSAQPQQRMKWIWGAAVLLVVLPILVYQALGIALWPQAGRWYVSPGIMVRDALNSFSLGLSVDLQQVWFLDIVFALVFVVGVLSIWQNPPRLTIQGDRKALFRGRGIGLTLLVGYIFIPIVGMWLYSLLSPLYMGSRYVIMCSPAFYLGLGVGIDALAGRRRSLGWLAGAVLVASMSMSIYRYFYHERYRTKEDYRSAAQFIVANERVGDAILVTAPENMTAFMHYYAGELPVGGMPPVSLAEKLDADELARQMAEWVHPYDRVWLVHCRTQHSDPDNLVTRWLDDHAMLLERKVFPSYGSPVTLSAYMPRSPIQGQTSAGVEAIGTFGDRLSLLDYAVRYKDFDDVVRGFSAREARDSMEPIESAGAIEPGKVVSAIFHWRPERELGNYKVSLRLVDSEGTSWAQRDRLPYMYYPTAQWPVGAQIYHEADLPIPLGTPPGLYHLQCWIYEADTGRSFSFQEFAGGQQDSFLDLGPLVVGEVQAGFPVDAFLPDGVQKTRLATVFGGDIELFAFHLTPSSAEPGEVLGLDLYWRARRAISRDYQVVINWEDERGTVWHTATYSPLGVDYPTSRWQAGAMLRGVLRVQVPEAALPGTHRIHLLIYAPNEEEFLWLRRGPIPWWGRDLSLAEITVQ